MDVVPLQSSHDYRRLLAAQAPLHPLPDAATDAAGAAPLHPSASYFFPLGPAASAALEAQWARVAAEAGGCGDAGDASWSAAAAAAPAAAADAAPGGGIDLEVMFGRRLRVSRAAGGAAWFTFAELMARPLGAPDYLAIAQVRVAASPAAKPCTAGAWAGHAKGAAAMHGCGPAMAACAHCAALAIFPYRAQLLPLCSASTRSS